MSVSQGGLLSLVRHFDYKSYMEVLNWHPDESTYSLTDAGDNPWLHMVFYDKFCLGARKLLMSYGGKDRTALTRSEWANYRAAFRKIYYHWYMVWYIITNRSRPNEPKFLGTLEHPNSDEWLVAAPYFTPAQMKAFRSELKKHYHITITNGGHLVGLSRPERLQHVKRLHDNKIRNNTQPRKPRHEENYDATRAYQFHPYVKESTVKRAENLSNKKGAKARNNAREMKISPHGNDVLDGYRTAFAAGLKNAVDKRHDLNRIMAHFTKLKKKMHFFSLVKFSVYWTAMERLEITDPYLPTMLIDDEDPKDDHFLRNLCLHAKYAVYAYANPKAALKYMQLVYGVFKTISDPAKLKIHYGNFEALFHVEHYNRMPSQLLYLNYLNNVDTEKVIPFELDDTLVLQLNSYYQCTPRVQEDKKVIQDAMMIFSFFYDMEELHKNYYIGLEAVTWKTRMQSAATTGAVAMFFGALLMMVYTVVKRFTPKSPDQERELLLEEICALAVKAESQGIEVTIIPQTGSLSNSQEPTGNSRIAGRMLNGRVLKGHMGTTSAAFEKVNKNKYVIVADGTLCGNLTFLEGGVALLNAHVYNALPRVFELYPFYPMGGILKHTVEKHTVSLLEDRVTNDTCIIVIPKMRPHASIIAHIASAEEMKSFVRCDSALISSFSNTHFKPTADVVSDVKHLSMSKSYTIKAARPYMIDNFCTYTWDGAIEGACGSTLFTTFNNVPKMCAMHTGGSSTDKFGVGVSLSKEDLYRFCMSNKTSTRCPKLDNLSDFLTMGFEDEGVGYSLNFLEPHGPRYVTPIITQATDSTTFVPTVFEDEEFRGGSPKIPANLSFKAYQNAIAKEAAIDPTGYDTIADEYIEKYKSVIVDKFYGGVNIAGCRTLTPEEALGNYGHLAPFDKQTSKGIRLKCLGLSKKSILEQGEDYQTFIDHLNERVRKMRDEGVFEYQLNFDKLKDELREPERVVNLKTRIFKITDFEDNVLMKMALGDLVSKTKQLHWVTPPSCGVNPSGAEWRMITMYFDQCKVICSDVKGFESTVSVFLTFFLHFLFKKAYNSEWSVRFACYVILATLNAIRFNRGNGISLGRQNTSGNWLTTWINTICNMLYFCVVVIHGANLNGEDPLDVLSDFKVKLYSDDNLVSLHRDWFTPNFIVSMFRQIFHIEVTSVDKGDSIKIGSIWDATFLSRGFRLQEGQVFCPLVFDSLIAQIYYVRVPRGKRTDDEFKRSQLQQNLNNVARELREYPRKEGLALAREIIAFIEKHHLPLAFPYGFDEDFVQTKLQLQ
jgi:hypothetical protein